MSNSNSKPSDVLLHFTKLKAAASIIKTGTLKIGSFQNSNDFYENLASLKAAAFLFNHNETTIDTSLDERKELLGKIDRLGFLSFSKATVTGADLHNSKLAFRRMWGQYADSFGGACLIFDKEKLEQECMQTWLEDCKCVKITEPAFKAFDIQYDDLTKIYNNHQLAKVVGSICGAKQFFERKHKDWCNEQEYRFLFYKTKDVDFPPISISSALIGIQLGDKNNAILIDEIYGLEAAHIKILIDSIEDYSDLAGKYRIP